MRKFFKISYEEFKKQVFDDKELYDSIILPTRSTKCSAAYDIRSIDSCVIRPGESMILNTGLKVCMNSDEVLYIYSRSSLGYKYNVSLTNCVGVIDADYFDNKDNEGHFKVKLTNNGKEDFVINRNDRVAQGVFMKYLTVDDEEEVTNERIGGIGSTGKGDDFNE